MAAPSPMATVANREVPLKLISVFFRSKSLVLRPQLATQARFQAADAQAATKWHHPCLLPHGIADHVDLTIIPDPGCVRTVALKQHPRERSGWNARSSVDAAVNA